MKVTLLFLSILISSSLFAKDSLVKVLARGMAAKLAADAPAVNCSELSDIDKEVKAWLFANHGKLKLSKIDLVNFDKRKYPLLGKLVDHYKNISKEKVNKNFKSAYVDNHKEAQRIQYLGRMSSSKWRIENLKKMNLDPQFCMAMGGDCDQTVEKGSLTLETCLLNTESLVILKSTGVFEEYSYSILGSMVDNHISSFEGYAVKPDDFKKTCHKIKSFLKSIGGEEIQSKLKYCQLETSSKRKTVHKKLCGGDYPYICKIKN